MVGFPVGTVTIEEITAPAGFKKETTVYKIYFRPDANGNPVAYFYENGGYQLAEDDEEDGGMIKVNLKTEVPNKPVMNTELTNASNGSHTIPVGAANVTDTVKLGGYKAGDKVTIKVDIYDTATYTKSSKGTLLATKTMDYTFNQNVSADSPISVNVTGLTFTSAANKTYGAVAYVTTPDGNTISHNEDMTVDLEKVSTSTTSISTELLSANGSHLIPVGAVTVNDTVKLGGYAAGTKVDVKVDLYDTASTTTPVATKTVTATLKGSTTAAPETVAVNGLSFTSAANKKYSAKTSVYLSGEKEPISVHNSALTDAAETVYTMETSTKVSKSTVGLGDQTVTDTITFRNVPSGIKVYFVSELYDVTNGASKATKVTTTPATVTSTAKASTGLAAETQTVTFTFYAEVDHKYAVKTMAYATIGTTDVLVGTHNANFADTNEAISGPQAPTFSTNFVELANGSKVVTPGVENTARDTITYSIPTGTSARAILTLYNAGNKVKVASKTVTLDASKTSATADFVWTPTAGYDYSVSSEFQVMKNGSWSTYLTHNEALTDAKETVYAPSFATKVASANVGLGDQTVTDTITYAHVPKDAKLHFVSEVYDLAGVLERVAMSSSSGNISRANEMSE